MWPICDGLLICEISSARFKLYYVNTISFSGKLL